MYNMFCVYTHSPFIMGTLIYEFYKAKCNSGNHYKGNTNVDDRCVFQNNNSFS